MMNELISVIVPVYNVEQYLEECIESILNQTYQNLEIILVNDGSTDHSFDICRNYEARDSRIIVQNKENGGLASARNAGLDIATGEYISFVDSDDTIEETMYEDMMEKFNADKTVDIVVCGFKRYDDITGDVYSIEMTDNSWQEITSSNIGQVLYLNPGVWNKLYKVKLFENIRFEEVRLAEDLLLFVDTLGNTNKIQRVQKVLYNYRVRSNSLINSVKEEQFQELLDQLVSRRKIMQNQQLDNSFLMLVDAIAFLHIGVSLTFRLITGNQKKTSVYINETKKVLDTYFQTWRQSKYLSIMYGLKKGIKGIGVWGCRLLYKTNLFILFVYFYQFIQNKLKIDIKW